MNWYSNEFCSINSVRLPTLKPVTFPGQLLCWQWKPLETEAAFALQTSERTLNGVRKGLGQGLLFRQLTSCTIARIIIGQFSYSSTNGPSRVRLWKNCCIITKSGVRSVWTGVAKWKAITMGRDRPRGSCVKKALHRQIFSVGCLQFVGRKHLHPALCSAGYGASTVARKVHRWMSLRGIATPL